MITKKEFRALPASINGELPRAAAGQNNNFFGLFDGSGDRSLNEWLLRAACGRQIQGWAKKMVPRLRESRLLTPSGRGA